MSATATHEREHPERDEQERATERVDVPGADARWFVQR